MRAVRIPGYGGAEVMRPIFDVVLDSIGGAVHARSAEVLKQVRAPEVRVTRERLEAVLNAKLKVPIEARFPLERAAQAYELSRGGHLRGKIVLQIS